MGIRWINYSDEEIVKHFSKEIKRLGIEDTLSKKLYMEKYDPNLSPSTATLQRRFGNWNKFINNNTEFTPQYRSWKDTSDKELLVLFSKELQRTVSPSGDASYDNYNKRYNSKVAPSITVLEKRFGSYNNILELVDWNKFRNVTWFTMDIELVKLKISNELARMNIKDNPTCEHYQKNYNKGNAPSTSTIQYLFGSWNKMLSELYTDYNRKN